MANVNNPNGFRMYGEPGVIRYFQIAAGQTLNCGDMVSLDGSKQVVIATSTSTELLGAVQQDCSGLAAGTLVPVACDPEQLFDVQCNGTFALSALGSEVDLAGTTGVQAINESATARRVLTIMAIKGSGSAEDNVIGNYTRVYAKIAKHCLDRGWTSGAENFGAQGLKTDLIAESTATAGVTIDGVLCKDSAVTGAVVGNVTGNCSGSSGSCTGNSATATLASTVTVADTTDATCSVALFEDATGSLAAKTDAGLTYAADTGTLTATAFSGPLTGNVTGNCSGSSGSCTGNAATASACSGNSATATTAGACSGNSATATLASTVTVADTTDATCSVALFEDATGSLGCKTDAGLSYAADTGTLSATKVSTGDLAFTGHVDGRTILCNAGRPVDTADWTIGPDGTLNLPTNKAAKKAVYPIPGLKVGEEIVRFRVVGALGAAAGQHTTVDASIRKVTKGAGAVVDAAIDAITQVDVQADTALDVEETLAAVETVATDYQYYALITCTTANDANCDVALCGVEVDVNCK